MPSRPRRRPPRPTAPATRFPPVAPAGPATLRFSDLTFRRGGARHPVVAGFSLTLAPGETVALAGPSGAGKSTLLFLAAGLLTPDSGNVTLGGQPLPDWDEHALRARLTLVPQRAALVAGTIRDNLALACDTMSDATAWAALRAAALDTAVRARGGLDAALSEAGAGLSGGEARRLVLARALLRRPDVLLLDEPTEGLDAATAARVLAGIRAALPDAAILIAAHRAEDRAAADRVIAIA